MEETIGPEKWSVRSGRGTYASRRQLPLKLAWAISIHKSQVATGMLIKPSHILDLDNQVTSITASPKKDYSFITRSSQPIGWVPEG